MTWVLLILSTIQFLNSLPVEVEVRTWGGEWATMSPHSVLEVTGSVPCQVRLPGGTLASAYPVVDVAALEGAPFYWFDVRAALDMPFFSFERIITQAEGRDAGWQFALAGLALGVIVGLMARVVKRGLGV